MSDSFPGIIQISQPYALLMALGLLVLVFVIFLNRKKIKHPVRVIHLKSYM